MSSLLKDKVLVKKITQLILIEYQEFTVTYLVVLQIFDNAW